MTDVPVILLPESLRNALGEAASRDLVTLLNTVTSAGQDRVLERMDERFAAFEAKLEQTTTALEAKLDRTAAVFQAKLDQATAELRAEIESKVSRAEARLIKWAFAFWASGVTALVVAILLK